MPDYINRGEGDIGFALAIGLVIVVIVLSLTGAADHNDKKTTPSKVEPQAQTEPKQAPQAETKKAEETEALQKEDCTFWRTMYFANVGKPMGNYYFITWQNCEAAQQ